MNRTLRELAVAVGCLALSAGWATAVDGVQPAGVLDEDYGHGMELVAAGKPGKAIDLLRRAAARALGPNLDLAQTGLAQAYREDGKPVEARAVLKGPIDRSGFTPALIEMARTYLYSPPFEPKRAQSYLKRVLTAEPRNVEALLELARAYLNDESLDQALDVYRQLTEEVAPGEVRGWLGLAGAHAVEKRFDKAKTAMRKAMTLVPRDPDVYFKMGDVTMADVQESGNVQKAIGWYERAIELGRDVPRYYGGLIYAYYRNGNNLAAEPVLARLESVSPGSSAARWARGVFAEYQGKTGEAVRLYTEAVATDAQSVYAHYSLGVMLSGRRNADFVVMGADRDWKYLPHRNIDRAEAELKTALALDPTFPFAARARAVIEELRSTPAAPMPESPETREMKRKLDDYYKTRAKLF